MITLSPKQKALCTQGTWDFAHLSALFINTSLELGSAVSNTQGLRDISAEIIRRQGISVSTIRAADHDIAPGVWPNMTEHGRNTTIGQRSSRR